MPQDKRKNLYKNFGRIFNKLGLLVVLLVFVVVMTFLSRDFLTLNNGRNLLIQSTVLCTLSLGVTFVIITGGIDLSVGAIEALSAAVGLGLIVRSGVPVIAGVLVMFLIGMAFGALNGILVTGFGIPPMIVTLATMSIARGAVLIYTNSANITPVPASFSAITYKHFLGLPLIVWIVLGLTFLAWLVLSKTVYGRAVYATGGNALASKLAGIRTKLVVATTYVISGFCAAFAGLLLTARLESAGPTAGENVEMNVIAAVVIGGSSLFGGRGTISGTVLGVVLISLVSNAVNLLSVPPAWDKIVKGVVIIIASLLDVYRNKYSGTGKDR